MNLGSFHKHIDNGGVTVDVTKDGDDVLITFSTSYCGYPAVFSTLALSNSSDFNTKESLTAIGQMLIDSANKLK